ncbi:MAG TPA: hypothetical protein VH916_07295 [Dehalococcoidia bacterium]|jgi:hypothetical protein
MAEHDATPPPPARRPINLLEIAPGARLRLSGDAIGEVVRNPRDGAWLLIRYLSVPADPSLEGSEELVFADDVVGPE